MSTLGAPSAGSRGSLGCERVHRPLINSRRIIRADRSLALLHDRVAFGKPEHA